jgi:hypothetical protein
LENPASQNKLHSLLLDDSSVLNEIISPEQRSRVLDVLSKHPSSLEKRSLWRSKKSNTTVLIEFDEVNAKNERVGNIMGGLVF